MATGFPYELKIPNQGVIRRFDDKTQLAKFVETEAGFFQGVSALLAGNVTFANINYGQSNLADQANRMFDGLRRALHGDDLLVQPFDEYVQAAEHLQILVAQGRIGSRVKDALKKEGQQEARWTILLLCSRWTTSTEDKLLDPFRAALFSNPATFAFGDLLTASDAVDRSSVAVSTIEQAKADLNAFIEAKTDLFEKLEDLYRRKLTLDEPALTWKKIAERKTAVWASWLLVFAVLVAIPIVIAVWNWTTVAEAIAKLTAGANGSFSVLATITVPALFYAWLLKNISRVFIQNLNLADDAAHRRSLALTYMGLLQDEKHPASDQDRAIILNALFRPIPPQTADEGPPSGLVDLIRSKQ